MSENPAVPVAPVEPPAENNAIKQMREQLNAVLAEKKASDDRATKAEALITESERAKLADNERLQLERDDARKKIEELSPLTARTEALEAKFTKLYEDKIAGLPADKQEQARNLSGVAQTPEARFDMLLNLEPLLVPVIVPKIGGSPTGIGAVGAVQQHQQAPATLDPKDWGSIPMHKAIQEVANDPDRASKLRFDLPKTPAQ
jgi:hypothetical protein